MRDDSIPNKPTVRAKRHQAYELNLNVRLLPAGSIPSTIKLACQPRQGAERIQKDPVELPESTRTWLLQVNRLVIAWLQKDPQNQQAFMADPIAAVQAAGVKLDRAQHKELLRLRESFGTAQAVVPGLQIRSIRPVSAKPDRPGIPIKPDDLKRRG
jgi:hypothetical protein